MSTSDIIKEQLNTIYGTADWKRLSKVRIDSTYELREFREPKSGVIINAYTHRETQDTQLYNGEKIIFGIAQSEDDLIIRIAEPFYFKVGESSEGLVNILSYIGKTLPPYLRQIDETEWGCDAGLHSRDKLVSDMVAGGFSFDLDMANDLNEDYGGPVYKQAHLDQERIDADLEADDDEELTAYEKEILAGGDVIFGVFDQKQAPDNGDGIVASFGTPEQFARDGHIIDSHLEHVLEKRGFRLPSYLGEDAENYFAVWEDGMAVGHLYPPTITKQQVIDDLVAAGFKFSQELDDFLNR